MKVKPGTPSPMSVLRWVFAVGAWSVFVIALRDSSETDGNDAVLAAVMLSPLVGAALLGWFDRTRSVLAAAVCLAVIFGGYSVATGAAARALPREPLPWLCGEGGSADNISQEHDPCPMSLGQQALDGGAVGMFFLLFAGPPHAAGLCWRRRPSSLRRRPTSAPDPVH